MKTIIKTLTTIALLSMIQCGWGSGTGTENDPIVLTSWYDITNSTSNNATYDATNGAYTLIAPEDESETKYYKFNMPSSTSLSTDMNLVIPKNVNVTNEKYIQILKKLEIKNNGTFENLKNSYMYTDAEDSSITFSGNGNITNSDTIYTYGENSSIIFSDGTADKPQIVLTSAEKDANGNPVKDSQGNILYGQIYLNGSNSSMTIGQYSILFFGDYGKLYVADSSSHSVALHGTIAINSKFASVDVSKMNLSTDGTIDMSEIQEYSDNVNLSAS